MIVYDALWETLEKRGLTQYALERKHGVSHGTMDALRKNRSITMNTLNDLCEILRCEPEDIIRHTFDHPEKETE